MAIPFSAHYSAQAKWLYPAALCALVAAIVLIDASAYAQFGGGGAGGGGGRHGGRGADRKSDDSTEAHDTYVPKPNSATLLPHAGTYLSTEANYFEVVYMPLQVRVYLYDSNFKPITARTLQSQMTVQFPTEASPQLAAFRFVPAPPGSPEQDYIVTSIDLQPLNDKEASFSFQFSGLANGEQKTASFAPHYANFKARAMVAQALPTVADRDAIARQRFCPVTGEPLGSRGPVVKVYVAESPLFLANSASIKTVASEPQRFLNLVTSGQIDSANRMQASPR